MSEATVLDTQVSAADATPLSDDRVDAPVLNEDVSSPAADGESSAQELQATGTFDGEELQARRDRKESLSSEEDTFLADYQSRKLQSQRDQENARNYARQTNQQRMKALADARPALLNAAVVARQEEQQLADYEGRPFSESMYQARLAQKTQPVMQDLEQVATWPVEAYMRSRVFQVRGDSPETRAAMADANGLAGALSLYENALVEYGKGLSDDGKKLAKLEAEHNKLKADHARLVGSDVKGSGASTQGKQASAGEPTYAQILKMKPEDVRAIPPDVYLRVLEKGA